MPLEQLEKLFEEVGRTAERLSRLRGQGEVVASRVGQSESVRFVTDLYAQLGRSPLQKSLDRLTAQLEKLQQHLEASEKKAAAEPVGGPSGWRRWQPHRILEPLARFGHYVAHEEAAGRPVHPLVSVLGRVSQFSYSFGTGRVITPSGRTVPWRRALAARLRGKRWARPLRRVLLGPDIAMRRVRLAWTAAQGGRAAGAGVRAAAAAGRLGMLASGAGAGGAGGAGAGAAGAAGAAGMGAASVLGVAAGAVTALAAALIGGTIALGKFAGAVRESASASLESYRQYAEMSPTIAAVMSQKEMIEMQEKARRGQMLAPIAQMELASYKQWTEGTRHLEILGSSLGSILQTALRDGFRTLIGPLDKLAELINRWIGIEEEKRGIKSPLEHPLLKAFELMRKGQAEVTMGSDFYRWPRPAPPKPLNRGPGEK